MVDRSRLFAVSFALALGAGLAGPSSGHEVTSNGVTVAHPWARATPGGATVGAAYMEIKTADGTVDRLIGAKSDIAGRVEVHTHIMDGDIMKMRRVDAIELAAGQSKVFSPGGDHVMLFDLKQPLKEGDLVKLTLTFEKAGAIDVEGTVEPVAANGPHGFDSQPTSGAEKSGGEEIGAKKGSKDKSPHGSH